MTEKSIFYKYHQRNFENKLSPSFFNKHTLSYKPIAEDFRNQKSVKFLTVGYPKSGNVWLNSMIAECLEIDVKPSINCFVTFTHSNLNTAILFDQSILRGACLIRDCRDIIVSYYYYVFLSSYLPLRRLRNSFMFHFVAFICCSSLSFD